jgi:hypothetical protein
MTIDWEDLAGAGFERFRLSSRDHALHLVGDYDLEAQLIAIKGVLRQNREAEEDVAEAIKSLDTQIRNYAGDNDEYHIHMENHWVDTLHETVFQDAAHSMSAVGMLAPFLESLLVSIFDGMRIRWEEEGVTVPDGVRGPSSASKFWRPNYIRTDGEKWRTGIVDGTHQLSDALDLSSYLPEDFRDVQEALAAYRNAMFHNGFEWPMAEREKFGKLIEDKCWPSDWFKKSTTGGKPWIYYMSEEFIQHCLKLIDQVLEGVGEYLEKRDAERS